LAQSNTRGAAARSLPQLVLFDRDGTLVNDVPYNRDPARVQPVRGAAEALRRLRERGIATGIVSNQSGVALGLLTTDDVEAVSQRVEELLGPFDTRRYCPHGANDGCRCRKPAPGMVLDAAVAVGVTPSSCAVVGDIGSDVSAALAAGARAILVPTPVTRPEEIAAAPEVAHDLGEAVDLLLSEYR
jgi:histidinol-phosphate phosphatase family protein